MSEGQTGTSARALEDMATEGTLGVIRRRVAKVFERAALQVWRRGGELLGAGTTPEGEKR